MGNDGKTGIEAVLDAEREVEAAIAEARDRAGLRLLEAREEAREIARRADEQIVRLMRETATETDAQIADLQRDFEARARGRGHLRAARLRAAVERTAQWLIDEGMPPPATGDDS